MAKKAASDNDKKPPFETDELRKGVKAFYNLPYEDPVHGVQRKIGSYKWGVYLFYDYDGEPIYVGQTNEKVSGRIGRHMTNQRTDAVAMSVLDPFEVFEVEVFPLPQFDGVGSKHPDFKHAKATLDALEHWVHQKAIRKSKFKAILNEKDPNPPAVALTPPPSLRARIVSDEVYSIRSHMDFRIARRAAVMARLAQVISEREVKGGLRRVLLTQAKRLQWLAQRRFEGMGGEASVEHGAESEERETEVDDETEAAE